MIDLLKRTDADVVVSDYETFDDRTGQTLERIVMSPKECISGNSYVWSDVCQKQYFVMHSITYRTSLLKENPMLFQNIVSMSMHNIVCFDYRGSGKPLLKGNRISLSSGHDHTEYGYRNMQKIVHNMKKY